MSTPSEAANAVRFEFIDKALESANTSAKEALATANTLIATAMISVKEATIKQEAATAEKIDSVKSETRIRFTELEKKLDTAIAQLQTSAGHSTGMRDMWGWLFGGLMFIASVVMGLFSLFR